MKPFLCYPWVGEPLATVGPLRWIPGRVRIGSKPIAEVTPIRQADTLGFWFQRLLFENMKKGLDLNLRRAKSPILNGSIFVSHRLGRECASASAMLPTVRLRLGLFFSCDRK